VRASRLETKLRAMPVSVLGSTRDFRAAAALQRVRNSACKAGFEPAADRSVAGSALTFRHPAVLDARAMMGAGRPAPAQGELPRCGRLAKAREGSS
jgi:hypothetical protein